MLMHAGTQQRWGSSSNSSTRSIKPDAGAAMLQLPFSCSRQQVATRCSAPHGTALPLSSSSSSNLSQQQQQQLCRLGVIGHQQPRPQHTEAAAASTAAAAFYDPTGSSNSSTLPVLPPGRTMLSPAGPLGANAGLGRSQPTRTDSSSSSGGTAANAHAGLPMQHASQQLQQQQQPPSRASAKQKQRAARSSTAQQQRSQAAAPRKHQPRQQQQERSSSRRPQKKHAGDPDLQASKLLTSAISQASCWQDLQKLLHQHSGRMNHIHAAALLNTTSKLVQYHQLDPQQQQAFAAFYVDALQLAYSQAQGSARPRELSSMLWAVARVGLHPGEDWLAAYLAVVQPQLQALNAQDMGLLVWALARFRLAPEHSFCTDLLAATQQQFAAACSSSSSSAGQQQPPPQQQQQQRGFDAQGLCNILWGLAVLEVQPGQQWLAAAAAAAQQPLQAGRFEPQGIAIMLWSLAKLGYRPQQTWLQAAADAAAQQLYVFKPAEVSMLCHGLARLHYQPQQQQEELAQQQQQQEWQPLLAQVQAVSWPQLQCLSFSEAANLVWALGVMGQQPAADWVASALQQLQATLHEADIKALSSACYGLAKMQHRGADGWWQAVWQHLPRLLGLSAAGADADVQAAGGANGSSSGMSALCDASQSQATFMWAAAKLGAAPPAAAADSLFAASQQLLQQQAVNGAELMAVVTAAAMLLLVPSRDWLNAVDGNFASLLLHSCAAAKQHHTYFQQQQAPELPQQQQQQVVQQRLSNLLLLQQQRQHSDSQQPQQSQAVSLPHPPLKPKEVSNVVFSLARLRFVPSAAALSALQQYLRAHAQQLEPADLQQLGRALQSWTDQLGQTVAAAAGGKEQEEVAPGPDCGCCNGGSSPHGAVSLQHAPAAAAAGASSALQSSHLVGLAQLKGVVIDGAQSAASFAAAAAASTVDAADLQGEEMLVYGQYLQLPLSSHSSSSSMDSSMSVSGFGGPGTVEQGQQQGSHAVSAAVPYRRRRALVHEGVAAVAGGLSVATG